MKIYGELKTLNNKRRESPIHVKIKLSFGKVKINFEEKCIKWGEGRLTLFINNSRNTLSDFH